MKETYLVLTISTESLAVTGAELLAHFTPVMQPPIARCVVKTFYGTTPESSLAEAEKWLRTAPAAAWVRPVLRATRQQANQVAPSSREVGEAGLPTHLAHRRRR